MQKLKSSHILIHFAAMVDQSELYNVLRHFDQFSLIVSYRVGGCIVNQRTDTEHQLELWLQYLTMLRFVEYHLKPN